MTSISSDGNTNAILLDSGNFVLRNGKSSVLWQSFDNPSDTLLPGMKLGYDGEWKKMVIGLMEERGRSQSWGFLHGTRPWRNTPDYYHARVYKVLD